MQENLNVLDLGRGRRRRWIMQVEKTNDVAQTSCSITHKFRITLNNTSCTIDWQNVVIVNWMIKAVAGTKWENISETLHPALD